MSDERWLSKDEREVFNGTQISSSELALLDHAEAADELIAELAEALRLYARFQRGAFGDGKPDYVRNALARVDALTKDTA